jgi:hypothetical protein
VKKQRDIHNFTPGLQGECSPPSFTPRGEHSLLFRRNRKYHPQGTKFSPGDNFAPGCQSLPLGAKLRMGLSVIQLWSFLWDKPPWCFIKPFIVESSTTNASTWSEVSEIATHWMANFPLRPFCQLWAERLKYRVCRNEIQQSGNFGIIGHSGMPDATEPDRFDGNRFFPTVGTFGLPISAWPAKVPLLPTN